MFNRQLTPQQRAVQAAHHAGFWRGFARGVIWANLIGLPLLAAFLVWTRGWW
jgi:hypothetical protein